MVIFGIYVKFLGDTIVWVNNATICEKSRYEQRIIMNHLDITSFTKQVEQTSLKVLGFFEDLSRLLLEKFFC